MPSRSKRSKVIEFPCSVCRKNVNNNHPAMVCSHCGLWSHNKCNNIDKTHYRLHQLNEELTFHCVKCVEDILPFMSLNDIEYTNFMVNGGTPSANNVTFTNFDPTNTQKQLFDKLNQEINDYNTREMDDMTMNQTLINYFLATIMMLRNLLIVSLIKTVFLSCI